MRGAAWGCVWVALLAVMSPAAAQNDYGRYDFEGSASEWLFNRLDPSINAFGGPSTWQVTDAHCGTGALRLSDTEKCVAQQITSTVPSTQPTTGSWTVSLYTKFLSRTTGGERDFFHIGADGSVATQGFYIGVGADSDSDGLAPLFVDNYAGKKNTAFKYPVPVVGWVVQPWFHIVATYDASTTTTRVYVNEVQVLETTDWAFQLAWSSCNTCPARYGGVIIGSRHRGGTNIARNNEWLFDDVQFLAGVHAPETVRAECTPGPAPRILMDPPPPPSAPAAPVLVDTDEAGSLTQTFTFKLTTTPASPVTLYFNVTRPDEVAVDPAQAVLTTTEGVVVSITGIDDEHADPDVVWDATVVVSSADVDYGNLQVPLYPNPTFARGKNINDDVAGVKVACAGGATSEDGSTDIVTCTVVLRSQPAIIGGTGTHNIITFVDVAVSAIVTRPLEAEVFPILSVPAVVAEFTPATWDTPVTFTVRGLDDTIDDGDQPYDLIVSWTSLDPAYTSGAMTQEIVNLVNTNDDESGVDFSLTSPLPHETDESGAKLVMALKLTSEPTADVTISLSTSNPAEAVLNPSDLTFTMANWGVAQAVVATGVDDDLDDGHQTFDILGAGTSLDPNYVKAQHTFASSLVNKDDDAAGVLFPGVADPIYTWEDPVRGTASFEVQLECEPTSDVTVSFAVAAVTGTVPVRYEAIVSPATLTFTPAAWSMPQRVLVTGVNDAVKDGDMAFSINPSVASMAVNYDGLAVPAINGMNVDDDRIGVLIDPTRLPQLDEGMAAAEVRYSVKLSSQPLGDVIIQIEDASADRPEVQLSTAALTFTSSSWKDLQQVTVKAIDDMEADGDSHVTLINKVVSTADPSYDGFPAPIVTGGVLDNDAAAVTCTPRAGLITEETLAAAEIFVALSSQPVDDVTVTPMSSNPLEGRIVSLPMIFTAANWRTAQKVTVRGVDDDVVDGDVAYQVTLSVTLVAGADDAGYAEPALPVESALLKNVDNDLPEIVITSMSSSRQPTTTEKGGQTMMQVSLASSPARHNRVVLSAASDDPTEGTVSPASLTYTSEDWSEPLALLVTGKDDDVVDGPVTYHVKVSVDTAATTELSFLAADGVSESVVNDDDDVASITVEALRSSETTESGGMVRTSLVLTSKPTGDVVVQLKANNAEVNVNPMSMMLRPATWSVPQEVTITGRDDDVADGDMGWVVSFAATSTDAAYNAIVVPAVSGMNRDDDVVGVKVTPTATPVLLAEAAGPGVPQHTASFTVVLSSEPTADVVIDLSSDSTEGTLSTTQLVFAPTSWSTLQRVDVTVVNDDEADGDVNFAVALAPVKSSDVAYDAFDPDDVACRTVDDDVPGIKATPATGLFTNEDGLMATFDVELTSKPSSDVVVTFQSDTPTEGYVMPPPGGGTVLALTFTPADWKVSQVVEVFGEDDSVADGPIPYSIVGTVVSGDVQYSSVTTSVPLTNNDNDQVGVTVSPTTVLTKEDGTNGTFFISLNSEPEADVTVTVDISAAGEEGNLGTAGATVVFTAQDFATPRFIVVYGGDDVVVDGDKSYVIGLSAESSDANYNGIAMPDVDVTNEDDDVAGLDLMPAAGSPLTVEEAGGTAAILIALTAAPMNEVKVEFMVSDGEQAELSAASVEFDGTNWNVPQMVVLSAVNDKTVDGDLAVSITSSIMSTEQAFQTLSPPGFDVTVVDDDVAGFAVDTPMGSVTTTEAGGDAEVTVVLKTAPLENVIVPVILPANGEVAAAPLSLLFTADTWETVQTVRIRGEDDAIKDGDVMYVVSIGPTTSDQAEFDSLPAVEIQGTNIDDDIAGVSITPSATPPATWEALPAGMAATTLEVVLTSQPTAPVTVGFASDTATEGVADPDEVVFGMTDWNVAKAVTLRGEDDDVADGEQTYTVVTAVASADGGYDMIDAEDVVVVNHDDDALGLTLSPMPPAALEVKEDGQEATFQVQLSSRPQGDVTLTVTSSDAGQGGATDPAMPIIIEPAAWDMSVAVTVTAVDDAVADGDSVFDLRVEIESQGDPGYDALSSPAPYVVTALDNDVAGVSVAPLMGETNEDGGDVVLTVALESKPKAPVTLTFMPSDPSEGSVSPVTTIIDPADWSLPVEATVTGKDDALADGKVVYTVSVNMESADLSYHTGTGGSAMPDPVALTNNDNDAAAIVLTDTATLVTDEAGTLAATYHITLGAEPTGGSVRIPVLCNSAEAEVEIAGGEVVFTAANWDTPQAIRVTGKDDDVQDGDKTWVVSHGPAVHPGGAYDGVSGDDVEGTNTDNDAAGVRVTPAAGAALETTEDGTASLDVEVSLTSRPTGAVTVSFVSTNPYEGMVAMQGGAAKVAGEVVFLPDQWRLAKTVVVTGVDDRVQDGDQVYAVLAGPAASDTDVHYQGLVVDGVDGITNKDDDEAGIVVDPVVGLVTSEDGGSATFTVKLLSSPGSAVAVSFVSDAPDEGGVQPMQIVFSAMNFDELQTVQILGADDDDVDGTQPYTVSLTIDTVDVPYAALTLPTLAVENTDDDTAGVSIEVSAAPLRVDEADTTPAATITIALSARPSADVTVPMSVNSPEAAVQPEAVTFTRDLWDQPAVVVVTGAPDNTVDGDQPFKVTVGAAQSADADFDGQGGRDVEGTAVDSDVAGVDVTPQHVVTSEDGSEGVFTVKLRSIPSDTVTLALRSENTDEATVDVDALTFRRDSWNVLQTVKVTGVSDGVIDSDAELIIALAPPTTGDAMYSALGPLDVKVTNLNVDTPAPPTPAPPGYVPLQIAMNAMTPATSDQVAAADGVVFEFALVHANVSGFGDMYVGPMSIVLRWPDGGMAFAAGQGPDCGVDPCIVLGTDVRPSAQPTGLAALGQSRGGNSSIITAEAHRDGRITVRLQDSTFHNPKRENLKLSVKQALFPAAARAELAAANDACSATSCTWETSLSPSQIVLPTKDEIEDVKVPAQSAAIVATSTAAVLGGSVSTSSLGNMARLSVLTKLCPETDDIELDQTLNPLGLSFGSNSRTAQVNGAVVGSIIVQVGLLMVSLVAAAVIRRQLFGKRRELVSGAFGLASLVDNAAESPTVANTTSKKKKKRKTKVVRFNLSKQDVVYIMARARFGWILLPTTFMYGGTALACVCALLYSETKFKILAAVDSLVFLVGLPAYAFYVAKTAPKHGSVEEVEGNATRPLHYKFFWGTREWAPKEQKGTPAWIELNRLFYDGYHMKARFFMVGETLVALALGGIAAWSPQTDGSCYTKAWLTTGVLIAWFLTMVVLRPYLGPYENLIEASIVGLEVAMMGFTIPAMAQDDPNNYWTMEWAGNLGLCVVWLITAKAFIDMTIFVIDEYGVWKEMKQAAVESDGALPMPRPFICHLLFCGNNIHGQRLDDHVWDECDDEGESYNYATYPQQLANPYLSAKDKEMDVVLTSRRLSGETNDLPLSIAAASQAAFDSKLTEELSGVNHSGMASFGQQSDAKFTDVASDRQVSPGFGHDDISSAQSSPEGEFAPKFSGVRAAQVMSGSRSRVLQRPSMSLWHHHRSPQLAALGNQSSTFGLLPAPIRGPGRGVRSDDSFVKGMPEPAAMPPRRRRGSSTLSFV